MFKFRYAGRQNKETYLADIKEKIKKETPQQSVSETEDDKFHETFNRLNDVGKVKALRLLRRSIN